MRIKRIKHAPPTPMDAITGTPPPAIHYAASVDSLGNVTGWTADVEQARDFDTGTVDRVLLRYTERPGAGQLRGDPEPEPEPEPPSVMGPVLTGNELAGKYGQPTAEPEAEQPRASRKGRRHTEES